MAQAPYCKISQVTSVRSLGLLCKIVLFLLMFIAPLFSFAQNRLHAIDSLLKKLPSTKEDTNKVNILWKLSDNYKKVNPDTGIIIGKQGLELAKKLNWDKGTCNLYNAIGQNYNSKSDFKEALVYFSKAIASSGDNKSAVANIYDNMGVAFKALGDYDSALVAHNRALNLFIELNIRDKVAEEYAEIGHNYYPMADYNKALDYYFKALKIYEEIKDSSGIAETSLDIGAVCSDQKNYNKSRVYYYNALAVFESLSKKDNSKRINVAILLQNIGNLYNAQKQYDSALIYFEKAVKIFEEQNSNEGKVLTLLSIAQVNLNQKNFESSLENNLKGLKIAEEMGSKELVYTFMGNIGEDYLGVTIDTSSVNKNSKLGKAGKTENLKKAIEYLTKGLMGSKEIDAKEGVQEYSQYLSDAYKLSGNYKEAYENYVLFSTIKDSINSNESRKLFVKLETESKKEIADKQIKLDELQIAKKKSETIVLYIGMVVMLFIIGLVVRSNMKQNKSNKIITREKKRSDELLLNILPAEVAEELKDKGSADAKYFDEVTVFFSDFVGFTKVSERMTPQQLVNELDACFKGFDHIMTKYNIEKIKTVGDAYLAVSGLPIGDPNHAEKIIKAAIEIRDFQIERKKQLGDMTFEVRIGAHSGSVVAGIVGVKKFAYDIWGDCVNTAARMEQNSQPGKINISESTYNIVKDKFDCVFRGKIQAKNKGELSMYFVEGSTDEEAEI